jgi:FAD binding domain/Berberine and berberine like
MTLTAPVSEAMISAIDDQTIEAFRAQLRGELLRPGDDGYDEARQVWNAMIDRRPALIVRSTGVADVIAAVNFAREHDLLLAVRGGGHNITGYAVCDGGLVIDLSPMKGIRVDPEGRTVWAEGGVTWGELDHETLAFGLAAVGGAIATTGIAGLTLGGGYGWLARKHGLVSDNLLAADVVTADGQFLHVSAEEHPELFWGLRGGGGNFGVVTAFQYQLHELGPTILAGPIFHPIEAARELFRFYRDFTAKAPDALSGMVALLTSPEGQPLAAAVPVYCDSPEAGEAVLRPLRGFGTPVADLAGPMPYCTMQALFDPAFPPGRRNYWKSGFFRGLDDTAIDIMVEHFARVPSPYSGVGLEQYGGAINRLRLEETAFPHRDYLFNFLVFASWDNPADDTANIGWARELWRALQPFMAEGVYVNYLGDTAAEGENRVRAAYGAATYDRLAVLKRTYDPLNRFRLNQNIAPV